MKNLIKKIDINSLILITLIFYMYFISKRGGSTRYIISLIVVLLVGYQQVYYKIKRKINFFNIISIIYILALCIIFYFSDKNGEKIEIFLNMTLASVIFMTICQNYRFIREKIKYFFPLLIIFSFDNIYKGYLDIWDNREKLVWYRIDGGQYTTVFAAEIGLYIIIGVIGLIYYKKYYHKILMLIYIFLNMGLLYFTKSRNSFLMLPLTLLILLIIRNFKKGIIISIISLAIGFGIFSNFENSRMLSRISNLTKIEKIKNDTRIPIYKTGLEIGRENLLTGIGLAKYREEPILIKETGERIRHFHNNFLETYVTQGIILLFVYIVFTLTLFFKLLRNYKESNYGFYQIMALASFIFYSLSGIFDVTFYFERFNQLVFTIITVSFIVQNTKQNS